MIKFRPVIWIRRDIKQPDAEFHHKEAHQQMPEAMNIRCSVTMATRPSQKQLQRLNPPSGMKNSENPIQMRFYNKNNGRNKLYEHFHTTVAYLKKKKHTYLADVQCKVHDGKPAHNVMSNKYDHQNLVIAL